jgi:hypothetical protein
VLTAARKVLEFQMTIAEWIGTAVILAVPYLLVGVAWTATHADAIGTEGVGGIMAILGSIASWPALLVSAVCMT